MLEKKTKFTNDDYYIKRAPGKPTGFCSSTWPHRPSVVNGNITGRAWMRTAAPPRPHIRLLCAHLALLPLLSRDLPAYGMTVMNASSRMTSLPQHEPQVSWFPPSRASGRVEGLALPAGGFDAAWMMPPCHWCTSLRSGSSRYAPPQPMTGTGFPRLPRGGSVQKVWVLGGSHAHVSTQVLMWPTQTMC